MATVNSGRCDRSYFCGLVEETGLAGAIALIRLYVAYRRGSKQPQVAMMTSYVWLGGNIKFVCAPIYSHHRRRAPPASADGRNIAAV